MVDSLIPTTRHTGFRRALVSTAWLAGAAACLSAILFLTIPELSFTGVARSAAADSIMVQQVYYYHTVGAAYDSCNVECMYGEIFIPSQDSLAIHFHPLCDSAGYEGSLVDVNGIARSTTFSIGTGDEITFWRAILLQNDHDGQINLGFPDTLCWTMRMFNAANGAHIATLDSVCILSQMNGMSAFPPVIGFAGQNSFELANLSMNGISGLNGVDSVYLKVEVKPVGLYAHSFYVRDDYTVNDKFSLRSYFQTPKSSTRSTAIPATASITAFPNPFRQNLTLTIRAVEETEHVTVEMFDAAGKRIATIYDGVPGPVNKRVFFTSPPSLASGQYILRTRSSGKNQPEPITIIRIK
jgi:hypothetical protein